MRRRTIVIAAVIALVVAVAVGTVAVTRAMAGPASLTGRSWTLSRMVIDGQEQPVSPARPATLQFRAGERQLAGNAGCNGYGGSYAIVGDRVRVADVYSTVMACADDGVMRQEIAYLQALSRVETFALNGDTLALRGDGGRLVLTFRAAAG